MGPFELLICILLIVCSAYISASESALFSLSRFQLRFLKENFRSVHRKIKKLLSDPGGLLVTILIVTEVLNIALAALIMKIISRNHFPIPKILGSFPYWAFETGIGTLITAPIVLFLCEITPKVIGVRANKLVATLAAGPLIIIYEIFKPVRFVLRHIIRVFSKRRAQKISHDNGKILKESDFLLLVEEGHKEGAIQQNELELIRNVFELDNATVAEVSTPLSLVLSFNVNTTVKEALSAIRSQRYSRIPVLSADKKEVVGVLYSKDLLRSKLNPDSSPITVAAIMRKPYFVNSMMKLNALFRKLKQHKTHMAIVRDPTGIVTGVVTMSDVLDALFEDLFVDSDDR